MTAIYFTISRLCFYPLQFLAVLMSWLIIQKLKTNLEQFFRRRGRMKKYLLKIHEHVEKKALFPCGCPINNLWLKK